MNIDAVIYANSEGFFEELGKKYILPTINNGRPSSWIVSDW